MTLHDFNNDHGYVEGEDKTRTVDVSLLIVFNSFETPGAHICPEKTVLSDKKLIQSIINPKRICE